MHLSQDGLYIYMNITICMLCSIFISMCVYLSKDGLHILYYTNIYVFEPRWPTHIYRYVHKLMHGILYLYIYRYMYVLEPRWPTHTYIYIHKHMHGILYLYIYICMHLSKDCLHKYIYNVYICT